MVSSQWGKDELVLSIPLKEHAAKRSSPPHCHREQAQPATWRFPIRRRPHASLIFNSYRFNSYRRNSLLLEALLIPP